MSSPHVTLLLADFMDAELSPSGTERVRSHLIFCNPCRQTLQEYQENVRGLKELLPGDPAPRDLEAQVLKDLDTIPVQDRPRAPKRSGNRLPTGKLVAGASVAVLIIWLLTRLDDQPVPPSLDAPVVSAPRPEPAVPVTPASDPPEPPRAPPSANEPKTPEPRRLTIERKKATTNANATPPQTRETEEKKEPSNQSEFTSLQAPTSGIETPLETVVRDQRSWNRLWNRFQRRQGDRTAPPRVDFDKFEVVVVAAGQQPSAGHLVDIQRVFSTTWEGKPARVVNYRVVSPRSEALTASVLTYPVSFRLVTRFNGETFFRKDS